ncbi:DUF6904 family protein [Chryseomicrobium palamuruense]|uniref:DUF6904 family protein n=1 Tax=Chryseomicrobium palamuruense TaxID=682973 RepID=A0ABV8UVR3_9BACL
MLTIQSTPHATGATISGDYWDFDSFLTAAFAIIGKTNRYYDYQSTHARLTKNLLELAAARKGHEAVLFVDNGASREQMKEKDLVGPQKNVYFGTNVLWPELLFTIFGLHDYIRLHSKEAAHPQLHRDLVELHLFQAKVVEALEQALPEEDFTDLKRALVSPERSTEEYATQYIDMLSVSYLKVPKEERVVLLPKIARSIVVGSSDYDGFKQKVLAEANKTKSSIHDIKLTAEYPEKDTIEW